jgi:hypothetical protein
MLRASGEKCDQVIRTLSVDAIFGLDEWEALCRNRNSYSLSLPAEMDAAITVLSCRDLNGSRLLARHSLMQASLRSHSI